MSLHEKPSFVGMPPHERLAWARQNAGFATAYQAFKQFAFPQSSYNAHERGAVKFHKKAETYAKAFNVPVKFLLGIIDDVNDSGRKPPQHGETLIELMRGHLSEPQSPLIAIGPSAFIEVYTGHSMTLPNYPQIIDGDYLAIDPERIPKTGDYVLADTPTAGRVLRRYSHLSRSSYKLVALNPAFPPIKSGNGISILGTLIFIARPAERLL